MKRNLNAENGAVSEKEKTIKPRSAGPARRFLAFIRWVYLRLNCITGNSKLSLARLPRIVGACVLAAMATVLVSAAFVDFGLQVYIDGEPAGFVENLDELNGIVAAVEAQASEILDRPYKLDTDLDYQFEVYNRLSAPTADEIADKLLGSVDEITRLYIVSVDGVMVGANPNGEALEAMVNGIVRDKLTEEPGAENASLLCDVDITYGYTSIDNSESLADIRSELTSNIRNQATYTVQEGDLFSDIAAQFGLSEEELRLLNPGVVPSELIAGDTVVVESAIPLMSVSFDKIIEYDEAVPFDVEYVYSSSMWEGDSYVDTEGVDGVIHHVDKVEYVDGVERGRETVSTEYTSEPVNKVIVCGTRNFIVPVKYRSITSYFGWRIFRGSSDYHTGLDLANSYGTKIRASYDGTVSYAGWKGNYGNCVIIDHGYGYQTLYAHCSRLAVSVGDKVSQGDLIAYMGATGRATGSHCHFEVRINGEPVNPYKYIFG